MVYPRVCGGTMRHGSLRRHLMGRSIPACAGEPLTRSGTLTRTQPGGLSPRVRGNPLLWPVPNMTLHSGLSPRVRGNLCSLQAT